MAKATRTTRMAAVLGLVALATVAIGVGPAGGAPSFVTLSKPSGNPGDSYDVLVACPVQPTGSVSYQLHEGTSKVVTFAANGAGQWRLPARVKTTDALYRISCQGVEEQARFDSNDAVMAFTPIGASVPTGVVGTDCDGGRSLVVDFHVGFRQVQHASPAVDATGAWQVVLPPDSTTLGVLVNATCGNDFDYETLTYHLYSGGPLPGGSTTTSTTATSPEVAPVPAPYVPPVASNVPPAPPAEPRVDAAHFTG